MINDPESNRALAHHFRTKPPEENDLHTPRDIRVIILGGAPHLHTSNQEAEVILKEIETEWICKLNTLRSNGFNFELMDSQVRT